MRAYGLADGAGGAGSGPEPAAEGSYGPLGEAWVRAVEAAAGSAERDVARLARGRAYARGGGVFTVRAGPGHVTAYVSGSRPRPYRAHWRLPVLSHQEWDAFVESVAARPAQVAAVLDGELPAQVLADAGAARLLPAPEELEPSCTCPDQGLPCKHAAALGYETGRLLDSDPGLLWRLRGSSEEAVRQALVRRTRAEQAQPVGALPSGELPHGPLGEGLFGAETPTEEASGEGVCAEGGLREGPPSSGRSRSSPRVPAARAEEGTHGTMPAREAFATSVRPPLPDPLPLPAESDEHRPAYPELPGAPSPDALAFLAVDAAARARQALAAARRAPASASAPEPDSELSLWHDTVRLAATHPRLTGRRTLSPLFAALARTAGRDVLELARAAAAWRQGEVAGLEVLDTVWDPPAGAFDRGRSALAALGITMSIHRNRLTHTTRPVQLRYGRDSRWYPYRAEPEDAGGAAAPQDPAASAWWPEGLAADDPVRALTGPREQEGEPFRSARCRGRRPGG